MIGVCLAAGAIAASLPLGSFTLAWTHSIEKIRWEEDYQVTDTDPPRLDLTEARIRGSGAGMEPPAGAVLTAGVWHYRPALPPLERLRLAHSPYATGYELCSKLHCKPLISVLPGIAESAVIEITPYRTGKAGRPGDGRRPRGCEASGSASGVRF